MERTAVLLPILFGILPSLFWFAFLLWEERARGGRDLRLLWIVFAWGMLITFPALLAEVIVDASLRLTPLIFVPSVIDLIMALFVVAPAEEGAKFLPVWRGLERAQLLKSPRSSMHIMIASALGFAAVENIFFAFAHGPDALPARLVTSTLLHAFTSGIFGLYLDRSLRVPKPRRRIYLWQGFIVASILHGVYDILAGTAQIFSIAVFLVVLGAAVVALELWPLNGKGNEKFKATGNTTGNGTDLEVTQIPPVDSPPLSA